MKFLIITLIPGILFGLAGRGLQPATNNLQLIYTSEIGVREATGRNDGQRVEEYLRYVGLKRGSPWCASFVCWALGQAGISNPRSGWCPDLFPAEREIWQRGRTAPAIGRNTVTGTPDNIVGRGLQLTTHHPQPADVFGLYFPEKKRIAHVGFVDEWGVKFVVTVEGNTNEAGSREGDGVYRKRRLISSIYKVARYE